MRHILYNKISMFLNETDKAVRDVVIHFQCETPL